MIGRWIAALRLLVVRVALKVLWSIGGKRDAVDGLPRLTSARIGPLVDAVRPGDLVLLGNNGVLTHIAVYVGDGALIHAMATEKTMRGWSGSVRDALGRALGTREAHVGVLREPLAGFVDRYERDTWVLVRATDVGPEQVARGLAAIEGLVGKPYDYGFSVGNEAWYCTEVALAYLEAARGAKVPLATRPVRVPMLLDAQVIEPVAVFDAPNVAVVAANEAARSNYADRLAGVPVAP